MTIPTLIYHYTNIEALISGIFNLRKKDSESDDEICLWATHCEYLNDTIDSYLGDILLHSNQEIKNILNLDLKSVFDEFKSSYIVSFSESKDCLPMWNMYGKNGKGIKLGFDFEKIICNPKYVDNFHHCVYENTIGYENYFNMIIEKAKKIYEEGLPDGMNENRISKDAFIYGLIHGFARHIKSQSYEHEKEWRIQIPAYKINTPIEFRYCSGALIPFTRQFFPKDTLKEIWIGPTNDMVRTEKSIKLYLESIGFDKVEIKKSNIPFRN
jgi:hypothetical protein